MPSSRPQSRGSIALGHFALELVLAEEKSRDRWVRRHHAMQSGGCRRLSQAFGQV